MRDIIRLASRGHQHRAGESAEEAAKARAPAPEEPQAPKREELTPEQLEGYLL